MSYKSPIKATLLSHAFISDQCPYCYDTVEDLDNHIRRCKTAKSNIEFKIKIKYPKYGIHKECGRVMILDFDKGLVLAENQYGRYALPIRSIKFDDISDIIDTIEAKNLSENQIRELISYLLTKCKNHRIISDIPCGSKIEIDINNKITSAVVIDKHANERYTVKTTTVNPLTLNISHRSILRVIE